MDDIERHLGFLLTDVARLLRTKVDQRARAMGMTLSQWIVIAYLSRKAGLSQNELAALMEVEPITVGRLVDKLEAAGLVERRHDPADRRIWRLYLTADAAPILSHMQAKGREIRNEMTAGIEASEVETVIDLLCRMKANLIDKGAVPLADDAA